MPECDNLSDEELLYLVGQTDKALFEKGFDLRSRQWEVPRTLMKRFGYVGYVLMGTQQPPIAQRIETAFRSIYRAHDLASGGHIGVFMYRDVFARIGVPHIFGTVALNPFDFVDLTPVQLRMIQTEPEAMETFLDQFADVADVQFGLEEVSADYGHYEMVPRFLELAKFQLHSASAVLTGGYDFRGAVQSALLATELVLKAGAAAAGIAEEDIVRLGHNTSRIARVLREHYEKFDFDRVSRVLASHPPYVANRYSKDQPNRREVGHLVMGSQYVASEVVRALSTRDFRLGMHPSHSRRYPA